MTNDKETRIPLLTDDDKDEILRVIEYHYGVKPRISDLDNIDWGLRSQYGVHHEQRIIRHLAIRELHRLILYPWREELDVGQFEQIQFDKSMFHFLTQASSSFREGIPEGAICLCRTALESGLREKLAEMKVQRKTTEELDVSKLIWTELQSLRYQLLSKLIELAEEEGILPKKWLEELFEHFTLIDRSARKVLDKFIHADLGWFAEHYQKIRPGGDVIGDLTYLQKEKVKIDSAIRDLAFPILAAVTIIAAKLWYEPMVNKKQNRSSP